MKFEESDSKSNLSDEATLTPVFFVKLQDVITNLSSYGICPIHLECSINDMRDCFNCKAYKIQTNKNLS